MQIRTFAWIGNLATTVLALAALAQAQTSRGTVTGTVLDSSSGVVAGAHLILTGKETGHPRPRVINVDGNPSYPKVVTELKREPKLGRRCRCRTCPYLNNMVEQDHRAIKRRVHASQGFRSFDAAWRTIQGYEVVHMIRKGQVRWLPKGHVISQVQFANETFGLKAA